MTNILLIGRKNFIIKNLYSRIEKENLKYTVIYLKNNCHSSEISVHLNFSNVMVAMPNISAENSREDLKEEYEFYKNIVEMIKNIQKAIPFIIILPEDCAENGDYEKLMFEYKKETGANIYIIRTTEVFGNSYKDRENCLISDLCNQISFGKQADISNPEKIHNLIFINDLLEDIIKAVNGRADTENGGYMKISRSFNMSGKTLVEKLSSFHDNRTTLLMPTFNNAFDKLLYSCYLSYRQSNKLNFILNVERQKESTICNVLNSAEYGDMAILKISGGERKLYECAKNEQVNKILAVKGSAIMELGKANSTETLEYSVFGDNYELINIPEAYNLSIRNPENEEFIAIVWSERRY